MKKEYLKMKYVAIIFVIALAVNIAIGFIIKGISYEAYLEKAALDDKLKLFLENLKPILQTGNDSLGIPILDPFRTEYQKIDFSEDKTNIVGELRDVKADGLSNYNVNEAKFKFAGLKITINITWPSIKFKSLYNLNAKFDDWKGFGLFGEGDVWIEASNLTFGAIAQLGIKSNEVFVKELSTGLSLAAIKLHATGIYNNEEASESISALLSSSLPGVIEVYQWSIVEDIGVRLKNFINSYLHDLTLQDIINIISQ